MRIGIDCRTILNPDKGEAAGVGHYTYQLVRHLSEHAPKDAEFVFFFDEKVADAKLEKFKKEGIEAKFFPFIQYKTFLPLAYSHFLVTAFLRRENLDLLHSPIPHLPLSYNNPAVVTVHDLAIYKYPKLFPSGQQVSTKVVVPRTLKKAKKIVAVSQATKNDIIELFDIPEDKIEVIYNGLDKRFFERASEKEIEEIKARYNIKKRYILFIGTLEPRKNIERLVEAFNRVRAKKTDWQLVVAGREGWSAEKIYEKAMSSPYRKDIIFTGYIAADDVNPLLSGAEIFVSPSIYEGFGMPVTEALAQGLPVITSKYGSLPEVAGKAAILIDPYEVTDIAGAINLLIEDKKFRDEIREIGFKQAQKYSWEKCARDTLKVYQQALDLK